MTACFGRGGNCFILLHATGNNNRANFHTGRKYARFGLKLLDKEHCLSDIWFAKQDIIHLCHVFGLTETMKMLYRHAV